MLRVAAVGSPQIIIRNLLKWWRHLYLCCVARLEYDDSAAKANFVNARTDASTDQGAEAVLQACYYSGESAGQQQQQQRGGETR